MRTIKYFEAVHEATDLCMAADPSVYVIGLGVTDPKGVFGTTLGLEQKYGARRVMDMPCAENGMTGVVLGSALSGMRPIMVHQRIDFALLAMEQIVNQAAKWHFMFGGRKPAPLVIRLLVGRGWGQGPQHSQSLHAWFAHVPGLKVVLPSTPQDAKGLLISAVEDDNPVIFIEHRWLHNISGPVPEGVYREPLGKARLLRRGRDVTIVAISHMALEAHRAAATLAHEGVEAEVIDPRTLRPFDEEAIVESVARTGRLLVADTSWRHGGFAGEVVARVAEASYGKLKCAPRRIALPECPTPTSPALAAHFYPTAGDIVAAAYEMVLGRRLAPCPAAVPAPHHLDVPDPSFTGPF
ncbi:MAG TPA: transketolase C-terminal domain-containing protein [Pirellulales bacterium]|nr:transketolase C-terminal domain-containing protein [Pirellulales bacterium]